MTQNLSAAEQALREAAREYHRNPSRGKISVTPTKPLSNQRDLSLAYSPGVAYPCLDIQADPSKAFDYTARGNLVGVITNGTAVLGLGDIGPLAGKPVMEGKGCLFKKFAGVDVFDIELDERDPNKLIDIIAALEPTLGGINLEDIKAPECFYIEQELSKRMNIPVFHDDQHGTAIISSAALLNGLELVGKDIAQVKVAVSGAGAAAIACVNVMLGLGVRRENVFMCDSKGLIYAGRPGTLDASKAAFAQATEGRTLADAVNNADVFLGCSAPGVLTADMLKTMADKPIILALANPEPEIRPELAKAVRPDCIIATGRSDYPNQVNNVLCFPYIFRGALDCGATKITESMKLACVREIAALAKQDVSDEVAAAYQGKELTFGPDYLIPTPFDTRLILRIAPAVAQAAEESGVATRPIPDYAAYREHLTRFVYQTSMIMRPVFAAAKATPQRVAYAEGEDERVLRAVQTVVDEKLAHPILIGRPEIIATRIAKAGLRLQAGVDFELCDPEDDPRFRQYWEAYHRIMGRNGVTGRVENDTQEGKSHYTLLLTGEEACVDMSSGPGGNQVRLAQMVFNQDNPLWHSIGCNADAEEWRGFINKNYGHLLPSDNAPRDAPTLTTRQLEVLTLLCLGKPNKVIARDLGLSENTVRVHVAAIFGQLGVNSRSTALLTAQRLGLLNTAPVLSTPAA